MTLRLLVVDDETDITEVIAFGARMVWPDCVVETATSGSEALRRFAEVAPDLVVLDVGLPPPDGFEVCRRLRERSQVPILMLTARDATLDKVRALELGADDYLTKPFDHIELFARLRALLRRARFEDAAGSPTATDAPLGERVFGDLRVDFAARQVETPGGIVRLTATESRLLEELVRHVGTIAPHARLLERVWGEAYVDEIHYLKVFIGRLRRKLGDDADRPRYIETHWGIGYRFVVPADDGTSTDGVQTSIPTRD
jgi:two-component system KDP operon response regulator KdpE